MPTAHVNIGSNLGPSEELLDRAAAMIALRFGGELRRAPIERSSPWGYESPNPYLNLGVAFETSLDPRSLLHALREIERAIDPSPHRDAAGAYIDRLIDIDVIALGSAVVDTPELTLPHPKMHLRPFVLRPMAYLDPVWRHPLLGLTAPELLARLSPAL